MSSACPTAPGFSHSWWKTAASPCSDDPDLSPVDGLFRALKGSSKPHVGPDMELQVLIWDGSCLLKKQARRPPCFTFRPQRRRECLRQFVHVGGWIFLCPVETPDIAAPRRPRTSTAVSTNEVSSRRLLPSESHFQGGLDRNNLGTWMHRRTCGVCGDPHSHAGFLSSTVSLMRQKGPLACKTHQLTLGYAKNRKARESFFLAVLSKLSPCLVSVV